MCVASEKMTPVVGSVRFPGEPATEITILGFLEESSGKFVHRITRWGNPFIDLFADKTMADMAAIKVYLNRTDKKINGVYHAYPSPIKSDSHTIKELNNELLH